MISSEVEGLARTGGLGDVVAALSLALAERGEDVLVVTPRYGVTKMPGDVKRWEGTVEARYGWGPGDVRHVGVLELPAVGRRRVCLVDDPGLFDRDGIYGDRYGEFGDNERRFAVMSRAALEIAARIWDGGPDIIHAHDWHASFAILYSRLVMGDAWKAKRAVFTVHNLAFQGVLDPGALDRLHLPRDAFRPEVLEHRGNVNLLKGATALADRITTVSPTYAKEILTPDLGFGLDEHLRAHAGKLVGILNGIDRTLFDPAHDAALTSVYDASNVSLARPADKTALAAELGLDASDGPLFGCVTRLTWQKGVDLLVPIFGEIIERGGRVVVVGQGDADLESRLQVAAQRFPGKVAVRVAFDPPLSRRVYGGVDFLFVPSRFEPCGLTQMYAMRYGAIPIVTNVGGLHDTVSPIDAAAGTGTGFVAAHADVPALRHATLDALSLWRDPGLLAEAQARGMAEDFGWAAPAAEYARLFEEMR